MDFSKKLRFFLRLLFAVTKKEYKAILAGLFLGYVAYFSLPKIYKFIPKPQKIIKTGIIGQYLVSDIPSEILQDISYGLTGVSAKGEPTPSLAENWSVSDDGKTYIFKVNPKSLYWHDGTKFSLFDLNYSFKDVEFSINKDSLMFKLKDPFSPFPVILSKPVFKKGLIGLGKYKVKKITNNGKFIGSILLVPLEGKSLPDKLYRFYNSENDLKTGFNLGEINTINKVFNLDNLFLGKSVKVSEVLMTDAYIGLFFNTSNPPYSSKTFRQALAYAVPKDADEKRALTPINPLSWAYNLDTKPYIKDLKHSQKLLESEIFDKNDFKITIFTFPQFEKIADLIKKSWEKIEINSEVKIISAVPENFEVLIIAREIPKDPDQYYFWHSTQAGNITQFRNPRIDKLLEDGRKINSKEERKDIYFDFQRFLIEESPVIFLSHPVVYNVSRI